LKSKFIYNLIKAGVVSEEDVIETGKYELSSSEVEKLLALGYADPSDFIKILENKMDIKIIKEADLDNIKVKTLEYFPLNLIKKHHFLPFLIDDKSIHLAMFDPTKEDVIKDLKFFTDLEIYTYGAEPNLLAKTLNKYFKLSIPSEFKFKKKNNLKLATNNNKPPVPNLKTDDIIGLDDEISIPDFDEVVTDIKSSILDVNSCSKINTSNIKTANNSKEVIASVLKELKKVSDKAALIFRKKDKFVAVDGFGMDYNNLTMGLYEDSIFKQTYDNKNILYQSSTGEIIRKHKEGDDVTVVAPAKIMDEVFALIYAKNTKKPKEVEILAEAMSDKFNKMLDEV
jgi:hypothetical protein